MLCTGAFKVGIKNVIYTLHSKIVDGNEVIHGEKCQVIHTIDAILVLECACDCLLPVVNGSGWRRRWLWGTVAAMKSHNFLMDFTIHCIATIASKHTVIAFSLYENCPTIDF